MEKQTVHCKRCNLDIEVTGEPIDGWYMEQLEHEREVHGGRF